MKKNWKKIFLSTVVLGFFIQTTQAYSPFFDFFKEIKASTVQFSRSAPKFPWWFSEPFATPAERLAPENTPFRSEWQPKPKYLEFRPNTTFDRTTFYEQKRLKLLNPVSDTPDQEEDENIQHCRIEGNLLSYDSMPAKEVTNRCCECNTETGKFDCEYENYNASKQQVCSIKDLEAHFNFVKEDENFSSDTFKRYTFDVTIKNHATRYDFKEFDLELALDGTVLQKLTFEGGLQRLESKTFPHTIFSEFNRGVEVPDGQHDLIVRISSDEEDGGQANNEAIQKLNFSLPKADLAISAFSVIKQDGNANILTEISNLGAFGSAPANGELQIFVNDDPTPIFTENIAELARTETITKNFSYPLPNQTNLLFSAKIIPADEDFEGDLTNNTFERLIDNPQIK